MHFHNAWRSFINEDIDYELQLLIESKFGQKAKYPELAERGFVERLKQLVTDRLGPRAVPKYIMWATKHLDFQRVHENDAEQFLRNQSRLQMLLLSLRTIKVGCQRKTSIGTRVLLVWLQM